MQKRPDIPTFKEKFVNQPTIYETERQKYDETKKSNLDMLSEAKKNLYDNDPSKIDVRSGSESCQLKTLKMPSEARAEVAQIKQQLEAYRTYK